MPKTHRGRPPTYPIGIVPDISPAEPTAEQGPEAQPEPPAASATRVKWVDYATAVGVDPTGLTIAQIKKKVG